MHKDLLLHPHIGSYSAMWVLAFATAFIICRWRARHFRIEGRHVDNLILLLMLVVPFGARLFNRLFYQELPLFEAVQVWKGGGLVFYGGLIFGVSSAILYCLLRKVPLLQMGDLAAPAIAAGLAVGRIGCFLSGCCWGDICAPAHTLAALKDPVKQWQLQTVPAISKPKFPLAVQFPSNSGAWRQHVANGLINRNSNKSLPVHPTQLYEAALALGLTVFLLRKKAGAPGSILWAFGITYGVARFLVEYLRADSTPAYLGFTISQVISMAIAIVCFFFLLRSRRTLAIEVSSNPTASPVPIRVK